MNEQVSAYLAKKKSAAAGVPQADREALLIHEGLTTRVYSDYADPENGFTQYEWNGPTQKTRYYKDVAIDVSDEEFEAIKEASGVVPLAHKNKVSIAMKYIAIVIYVVGAIAGIAAIASGMLPAVALAYWGGAIAFGSLFLALAEIIKLLKEIALRTANKIEYR